jgi:myosin heavy subunit
VFELEEFRRERLEDLAVLLQKMWRGYKQRKEFLLKKHSQIVIASAWRSWRVSNFHWSHFRELWLTFMDTNTKKILFKM